VQFLIRSVLRQERSAGRTRVPGPGVPLPGVAGTRADGIGRMPSCGAGWKAIDVSHGPACPRNLLDEAMDTPNGVLVRRCFRIMGAKSMGLTITLSDITEEEFRAMEMIEAARQEADIDRGQRRTELPGASDPQIVPAVGLWPNFARRRSSLDRSGTWAERA